MSMSNSYLKAPWSALWVGAVAEDGDTCFPLEQIASLEVFASMPLRFMPCSAFKCWGILWGEENGGPSGPSCAVRLTDHLRGKCPQVSGW